MKKVHLPQNGKNYFRFHHFRTYFLYTVYSNISRPVHDPSETRAPRPPPTQKSGGLDPQLSRIDSYEDTEAGIKLYGALPLPLW